MTMDRRNFLESGGVMSVGAVLAAIGLLDSKAAWAQAPGWNKAAFETKTLADTIKALGGTATSNSNDIVMNTPDIAENGAVVPVGVTSKIPGTTQIYVLVEKNPNMLAAGFTVPAGTEPNVQTRIKMAQTSNVLAVVKANNQFFVATKEVKVTLGGCGG